MYIKLHHHHHHTKTLTKDVNSDKKQNPEYYLGCKKIFLCNCHHSL